VDRFEVDFDLRHRSLLESRLVVGVASVDELQGNVEVAHAEEIVVDEELEDVGDVGFVGLKLLAEYRPTLEEI
jgi:hypothetical protein